MLIQLSDDVGTLGDCKPYKGPTSHGGEANLLICFCLCKVSSMLAFY